MTVLCHNAISQQQNQMSNLRACLQAVYWLISQISLQQNVNVLIPLTFLYLQETIMNLSWLLTKRRLYQQKQLILPIRRDNIGKNLFFFTKCKSNQH